MYAVIESGGKQLRVQVGDVVRVERLSDGVGDQVTFDRVLAVGAGEEVKIGTPTVDGAAVKGSVVAHDRGDKVIIYTYKPRQNSNRRRAAHRQNYTSVKIDAIES